MHNIDQIVMLLRNAWNKINNWIELEMIAESWKPQLLMLCSVYFCFIQSGPSSAWESRLAVFISFAFTIYTLSLAVHILSVLVHSKQEVLLAGKKKNLVRRLHIIASVIDRSDLSGGVWSAGFNWFSRLSFSHPFYNLTEHFGRSLIPRQRG